MERRSILEKLGLIEKNINENENNSIGQSEEDVEQIIPVEAEKPQFADYMKKVEVKPEVQAEVKTSIKLEETVDPIGIVKKKKLLKIDEIYKNYDINSNGINSLSIVESFQKALPDYLPTDVKRQSILNIIASSNVQVESLVKDGSDKLNCLKDFSRSFTEESRDVISNFEDEIKKLNEKINSYKTAIDNMKKLQSEQDFTVKYEMDKINNIMQFINPEI
ncbi:MAG: hypothetical protein K0R07_2263 [Sedimentibacter sp.]|jgi:hypothetical protein|nr:hypothetical protein [Sedimentibacter sp.]